MKPKRSQDSRSLSAFLLVSSTKICSYLQVWLAESSLHSQHSSITCEMDTTNRFHDLEMTVLLLQLMLLELALMVNIQMP